jgi:hypothetical protein
MHAADGKDTTPTLVTGVVEHEYFKFRLQKQVEAQVSEYLLARVKMLGTFGTVIVTLLGIAGVQRYLSFTSLMDEVQGKFDTMNQQIRAVERLTAEAQHAVASTKPLLDLAHTNVKSSQALSAGAGATARQTSELAQAVLQQVHATQADVRETSKTLKTNVDEASDTITRLKAEQDRLGSVAKDIDEIRKAKITVSAQQGEIDAAAQEIKRSSEALTKGLDFQRQLAMARTFDIVLLRDRQAVELTLPDFLDSESQTRREYKLRIEAKRIKDDVDFRITVNGREPAAAFDGFTRKRSAPIPGTPFEVLVDSIYHAKLAYDFVLLRIKPIDDRVLATTPAIAATGAKQ